MSSGSGRSRGLARVADHRSIAQGYREMTLVYTEDGVMKPGKESDIPRPGRFFTLLPVNFPVPLLRRPFAYADADENGFSFIYEIRGTASQGFSTLEKEDVVDWIGPLGTGFPEPPAGAHPILIAGGIGIGPILYLARSLIKKDFFPTVVLGARTAELIPDIIWPKEISLQICTDNGSAGIRGTVLNGIPKESGNDDVYYCCGPMPMMAAVHTLALSAGRTCWVSLEERMACGVGACCGCAVKTVSASSPSGSAGGHDNALSYKCACSDGPVFDSREVVW